MIPGGGSFGRGKCLAASMMVASVVGLTYRANVEVAACFNASPGTARFREFAGSHGAAWHLPRLNMEAALNSGLMDDVPATSTVQVFQEYPYWHNAQYGSFFYAKHANKRLIVASPAPTLPASPTYQVRDLFQGASTGFVVLSQVDLDGMNHRRKGVATVRQKPRHVQVGHQSGRPRLGPGVSTGSRPPFDPGRSRLGLVFTGADCRPGQPGHAPGCRRSHRARLGGRRPGECDRRSRPTESVSLNLLRHRRLRLFFLEQKLLDLAIGRPVERTGEDGGLERHPDRRDFHPATLADPAHGHAHRFTQFLEPGGGNLHSLGVQISRKLFTHLVAVELASLHLVEKIERSVLRSRSSNLGDINRAGRALD